MSETPTDREWLLELASLMQGEGREEGNVYLGQEFARMIADRLRAIADDGEVGVLTAVTRDGVLQPAHLRGWATALEENQRYSGVNVVVRYSELDLVAWLRGLADALEIMEAEHDGQAGEIQNG